VAGFKGKFDSVRQDWPTPQELFDTIDAEFNFTLDAAASAENTKVARRYFTAEDNALVQDWGQEVVWLNPPYGNKSGSLQDWVKKSHDASTKGATVVMLIPARTNTNWFHDYCLALGEVRFVRGRPKFGDATHGLPQPLCYIIFRPTIER
jgi:phage N-6-adenine-methyltransferase